MSQYTTMDFGLYNSDQASWGPMQGKPPEMKSLQIGERTGIQSVITSPWVLRWQALPTTYNTYRQIRKHPTVALARACSAAPVMAAEWTVESKDGVPDEISKFIQDELFPLRQTLLETCLFYGNCDFGYQGYEKVFTQKGGHFHLAKLKPLLHDITEIIISPNGAFEGFKQPATWLGIDNAMLIPFRVEGSLWYGTPLLENVREHYYQWLDANDAAGRYDRKVAGGRIVVHYPPGKSRDQWGIWQPNEEIARTLVNALQSAGTMAIPRDMAPFLDRLSVDSPGWLIDVLDKGAGLQPTFTDRLNYLDKLLVRGILMPERVVLEGQHGTLAEAEAHADVALTNADLTHRYVTQLINFQVVDQLLRLEYGEEMVGQVWLEPSPILDTKQTYLRGVYTSILTNPQGFQEEFGQIDTNALKDNLGIPKTKEVSQHGGAEPGAIGTVPGPAMDGVDPNSPMAASIRRIYATLGGVWEKQKGTTTLVLGNGSKA